MDIVVYNSTTIVDFAENGGLEGKFSSSKTFAHKLKPNLGLNLSTGLKEELFLVIKGEALLSTKEAKKELKRGDIFTIPPLSSFSILAKSNLKFIRTTKEHASSSEIEFSDYKRLNS